MTMVRGSNPIWFEVDLTAHAFDDTFYLFILENDIPYIPATVWQDPYGNTPWSNPIRFFANGTLPNNIYYDPDAVYRLEFRQGATQQDPLIYLVENYVPGTGGNTPVDESAFVTDNQITNPQFALINFQSPLTLNNITTQVLNIAPGWFLNLTGAGSVTLTQVLLNSSVSDPTNASYALQIQLSGAWTNVYLSQRFKNNALLWANTFVSSSITALSGNAPQIISATLNDSQGSSTSVLDTTSLTANFNVYGQASQMPASTDTDFPPTAYLEYQLLLPNNGNITLTSVQLIDSAVGIVYPYEQTTIERQIDHTFNYYNNPLQFKPIPSLLTGWDFPLNPAQLGTSQTITTTPAYIWDQTICASAVNNFAVLRNTTTDSFGVTSSVNNDAFYMLQYLEGAQAFEATFTRLAVNISMVLNVHPNVVARVYLFYSNNGGTIPTLPTTIGTIANTGIFTLTAANWGKIPQNSGFSNTFTLDTLNTLMDLKSIGWDGTQFFNITTTANFAIVVTFAVPTAGTAIVINSISCIPGDIATRPAPQSPDEVLRECQYYLEVSDPDGMGVYYLMNSLSQVGSGLASAYASPFEIQYQQKKRVPPLIAVSSANANTPANVSAVLNYSAFSTNIFTSTTPVDVVLANFWNTPVIGTTRAIYTPKSESPIATTAGSSTSSAHAYSSGEIAFKYFLDSRLGKV